MATTFADDPDGLQRFLSHRPGGAAATFETRNEPVVTVQGRKLHSGRDPLREARRFVRTLDLAEATMVILLGYGSGHIARAIASRCDATIVVFEPNLDVLHEGLGHGEVPPKVRITTTVPRLGQVLYSRLKGSDKGVVVPWAPSMRTDPELFADALDKTKEAIDRAQLRHRTAIMRGAGWLRHYLQNLAHVVRTPGLPAFKDGLRDLPAIIVAAGPSLDRNVKMLAGLQNQALIMAVNTAAQALERAGVRPHAIVAIESLDVSAQLRDIPWLAEVPAFLELTGHPALWDLPFRAKIPISVDTNACSIFSARLDPNHHLSAGFCVANAATSIAYAMGCNPIILVGSDLAYAGDRVYASGTVFEQMRAKARDDGSVEYEGLDAKRTIEQQDGEAAKGTRMPETTKTEQVKSWDGQSKVTTTRDFLMFRDWYAYASETLGREGVEAINATEGGAYIPGWRHESLANVVQRHRLDRDTDDPPALRRFEDLLAASPTPVAVLQHAVTAEQQHATRITAICDEALQLIDNDPEGDLRLDLAGADRIADLNAETRQRLHNAPLASEAVFGPIEDLRARGEITTFSFYSALREPLESLNAQLARLLQELESDLRRAS